MRMVVLQPGTQLGLLSDHFQLTLLVSHCSTLCGTDLLLYPDSTYSISAFSLSLSLILKHRQVTINPYSKIGRVESDFLSQLVTQADVEAKADNCMKVYA